MERQISSTLSVLNIRYSKNFKINYGVKQNGVRKYVKPPLIIERSYFELMNAEVSELFPLMGRLDNLFEENEIYLINYTIFKKTILFGFKFDIPPLFKVYI